AVYASRWVWIERVHGCRIALTSEGIFVPRSRWTWFCVEEFIAYRDITNCRVTVVKHLGAKDGISQSHFRGPAPWIDLPLPGGSLFSADLGPDCLRADYHA